MKGNMKKAFHANSFKYGTFSLIMSIIVIAIVIGVNMLMTLLPSSVTNIDMTAAQLFSIGETTEEIVTSLSEDITIYVLGNETADDEVMIQTLDKYADLSSHIKIERVNPDKQPSFLGKYDLTTENLSKSNDLIVESAKRFKFIPNEDIYEVDQQSYMYYMYGYTNSYDTKYDCEGEVTSAIAYVTSDDLPVMYILTGHNETELGESVMELLKQSNISTKTLNLISEGSVPEDCNILMIYRATSDFSESEIEALEKYVAYGGKLLVFNAANSQADMKNYAELLNYYGVTIPVESYVFESNAYCYYPYRWYVYEPLGGNSLTESLKGKNVFTTYVSPILQNENKRNTLKFSSILSTSSDSWLRSDLDSKQYDEKIASDVDGPFDYAVSILDQSNEGEGQVVLFSSLDFLELDTVKKSVPSAANGEVFMNVIGSMAKLKSRISIPSKSVNVQNNTFTTQDYNVSLLIFVILIPVLVLIAGFCIWITRRRK